MKRAARLLLPLLLLAGLVGCATTKQSLAPGANLAGLRTFYVQKLPADQRGIERVIADQLTMMGYQATYGTEEMPGTPVDAIVTYQDKWMWDITMYMLQLNIQIRDGKTRMILAEGQSYRPSLQRKTPEGMTEEVLKTIFK